MNEPRAIEPLTAPLRATVELPGSKSITNRALLCAALADGTSTLHRVLDADDTAAMAEGLTILGVHIARDGDTAQVVGARGRLQAGEGVRVDARLSGTTSRFLLAAALAADGPVTVDGEPPLRARPMADGLDALAALGAGVDAPDGRLPATVRPPATAAVVSVSGAASSQFLSGLLLAAPCLPRGIELAVDGELRSIPYVELTIAVMGAFGASVDSSADLRRFRVAPTGYRAADYEIEPDASAASYFFAAAAVTRGEVTVDGLGSTSLQGDVAFVDVLARMGAVVEQGSTRTTVRGVGSLRGIDVDMADISDTVPTLAAVAPFADGPTTISGVGFIRGKETDRIGSVVAELNRCGIRADELPDGLRIHPGRPVPTVIQTYDDHRMAMSFAVMGLAAPGISIADAGCVDKTFPRFWDVLESTRSGS